MPSVKTMNSVLHDSIQNSQTSISVHPKLVKQLRAVYDTADPDKFFDTFIFYLRFPISGVTEWTFYIDRILEFVAKFACSFLEKEGGEDATEDEKKDEKKDNEDTNLEEMEELPTFLYRLFAWLLDHHDVEGSDCRLRVCKLLNKILKYMGVEGCIDDELYNKIYDGMLDRLKDKVPEIRAQAATALQRLQDPRDEECPIIKAYLFHLAHDPSNVVRRTIVRCIGATRLTLPHILSRTRDTDEHVRRLAYRFLVEKVHIKSLTIGQREGVLQRGLRDRSEVVKRVVEKEMLPRWLRLSDNSIVQLLHYLDVGNSDQEVKTGQLQPAPAAALEVLFADQPYKDVFSNFKYLDADKLIPFDKLTAETAMYWRVLAQYLDKEEGPGASEYLEELLPELTQFCSYVRRYILELDKQEEDDNWEFIAKELITICSIYDLGDEFGRQSLNKLIKDMLISSKTPPSFIRHIARVFNKVVKNTQSRIEQLAEIISELKDPMTRDEVDMSPNMLPGSAKPKASADSSESNTPAPAAAKTDKEKEKVIRRLQMDVAKTRVKIIERKEELNKAVADQEFMRAQELKHEITALETELQQLSEDLQAEKDTALTPAVNSPVTTVPDTPVSIELPERAESEVDSPTVTFKCLRLIVATLQDPAITQLNATLLTLMEEIVLGAVQSELSSIRKEAFLALCCCCLRSIDIARQHMLLFLQAAHIDVPEVRICAIACVTDLLMMHGLASFISGGKPESAAAAAGTNGEGADSADQASSCASETASNIESAMDSDMATRGASLTQSELESQGGNSVVAILTKMLDEPDMDLRTKVAEGLCKLLMIGAISSPKLLSRLLLIWYNPMTEADSKLRHILGTFFPLYASMSKAHQLSLEGAFIPTMKVLFDAPGTSPLSEIDTEDVGMFFVNLTREDFLQSYADEKKAPAPALPETSDTNIHDSMAFTVCNEILSSPDSFQTKVLIKILTSLQLTVNNFVTLRELKVLSEQQLAAVKEKSCLRSLERFDRMLAEWLSKDPSVAKKEGSAVISPSDASRRKSSKGSPNKTQQADISQTPKRRRVLFSQSMIGNPLLEDGPSGLTPGVRRSGAAELPSPVVVSQESVAGDDAVTPKKAPTAKASVSSLANSDAGDASSAVEQEDKEETSTSSSSEETTVQDSGQESGKESVILAQPSSAQDKSADYDATNVEFSDVFASTRIETSNASSTEEVEETVTESSQDEEEEEEDESQEEEEEETEPEVQRQSGRRKAGANKKAAVQTNKKAEKTPANKKSGWAANQKKTPSISSQSSTDTPTRSKAGGRRGQSEDTSDDPEIVLTSGKRRAARDLLSPVPPPAKSPRHPQSATAKKAGGRRSNTTASNSSATEGESSDEKSTNRQSKRASLSKKEVVPKEAAKSGKAAAVKATAAASSRLPRGSTPSVSSPGGRKASAAAAAASPATRSTRGGAATASQSPAPTPKSTKSASASSQSPASSLKSTRGSTASPALSSKSTRGSTASQSPAPSSKSTRSTSSQSPAPAPTPKGAKRASAAVQSPAAMATRGAASQSPAPGAKGTRSTSSQSPAPASKATSAPSPAVKSTRGAAASQSSTPGRTATNKKGAQKVAAAAASPAAAKPNMRESLKPTTPGGTLSSTRRSTATVTITPASAAKKTGRGGSRTPVVTTGSESSQSPMTGASASKKSGKGGKTKSSQPESPSSAGSAISRAGRNNSPRIDYRTGARLDTTGNSSPASQSSAGSQKKTPTNKRAVHQIRSASSSSAGSSPVMRKKAKLQPTGGKDSKRSSLQSSGAGGRKSSRASATTSEDEEVIINATPTNRSRRSRGDEPSSARASRQRK